MLHGTAAWIAIALALMVQPKPAGETRTSEASDNQSKAEFDYLVPSPAKIDVLATGFGWSEGPVWIEEGDYLLFSDVPANRIHRWTANHGVTLFLHPSGGTITEGFREPGANGLKPGGPGAILLADQGNRAIALVRHIRCRTEEQVRRRPEVVPGLLPHEEQHSRRSVQIAPPRG